MRLLHAVALLLVFASSQPLAWENHSLASYRAFERMPEVATASMVTVESLEAFLRSEESTVEALLASQEAWSLSNLEKYPPRPATLAFVADASRPDDARRLAFLTALRVAPNSKFALFYQIDPWNPTTGTALPQSAVSTLPETPGTRATHFALKPGDQVSALTVLASATDEPDLGLDINLWEDSPSDWGSQYGFGPQPFGNPELSNSSEAPFHMAFLHENRLLYLAAPSIKQNFALMRAHQFSTLASLAFRTGHAYWGWRFAGLSLHYVQDLTQPYHATLAPGQSTVKLLLANALAMAGMQGMKNNLIVLLSNRHLVLEKYQTEMLLRAASKQQETSIEKALRNLEKDKSYPEWSGHYLNNVVSAQAYRAAGQTAQAIVANMPTAYVSDPSFDFGARSSQINLLQELSGHGAGERAQLESVIAELMGNFGAHSRNALRGILKASDPT